MNKKWILWALLTLVLFSAVSFQGGCGPGDNSAPQSSSGVKQAQVQVKTDTAGHTTEQNNVTKRYEVDNLPGSIKHLYIISAYSGQVLLYSTVAGKVTSSGKRLTPTTVATNNPNNSSIDGIPVSIGGLDLRTGEVLQDDGTYGSSVEYIFWFDSKGIYHQQYITGGMILHVSSEPISVKGVVINLESTGRTE